MEKKAHNMKYITLQSRGGKNQDFLLVVSIILLQLLLFSMMGCVDKLAGKPLSFNYVVQPKSLKNSL